MWNELIKSEEFKEVRAMLGVFGISLAEDGPSMDLDGSRLSVIKHVTHFLEWE